ncbi:MAG: signal recognition particle-docking protein FtsY [Candidatus Brockarchaeota archaeon]|nr:signal recognition particle-docking protein FtsY [Candidatus Brockarchaeota archaeon]
MSKLLGSSVKSFFNKLFSRKLSDKELEELEDEFKLKLVENDVAYDLADVFSKHIVNKLNERKFPILSSNIQNVLIEEAKQYLLTTLPTEEVDLIKEASNAISSDGKFIAMFIGSNGTGKSTTLAKFAKLFKEMGFKPLLVCADTFRAGAIEQLKHHASLLNLPFYSSKYGDDPASVAYDAIKFSEDNALNVILIDTAGRAHMNVNLMNELRKIKKVVEPNHTILVIDALTGNDAVEQARLFLEFVGFDSIVLTKFDADVKGGTAISVSYVSKKPISYVGVGQKYSDLRPFSMKDYVYELLFS